MKAVIQLVRHARLESPHQPSQSIQRGMMILIGFKSRDDLGMLKSFLNKILQLRIFPDKDGKTNLTISDIQGDVLWVPNFTLYASTKQTRRPSFSKAAKAEEARILFTLLQKELLTLYPQSYFGFFGMDMTIDVQLDGPFTLVLDSEDNHED